jgi:hypothetical protein
MNRFLNLENTMLDHNHQAEIQPLLDELLRDSLIPFALTAYPVQGDGRGEYLMPFNDSRIHSCKFSWKEGECFKEIVRAAVLARVDRISGPLHRKATVGQTTT